MASNAKDKEDKALKKETTTKKTTRKSVKKTETTKTDNNIAVSKDDFLAKLEGIVEIAKKNKDVIESDRLNDYFKDCKNEKSNCKVILSTNLGDFNVDIESLPISEYWKKYASPKEED